jgi:hypothetical protein
MREATVALEMENIGSLASGILENIRRRRCHIVSMAILFNRERVWGDRLTALSALIRMMALFR